jgi:hypothetical protein
MTSPVAAHKPSDPIRSKGGAEEKCLAAVAKQTNRVGVGTNRIEESQASIEIYVNVPEAQAPWVCRVNRDGTLGDVFFSGSEGAL